MERVDSDEIKIAEVRKHVFGIIAVYAQSAVGMMVAIALAYFLLPIIMGDEESAFLIATVFSVLAVGGAFFVIMVASYIYRQNRIIITDRNITQVLQYGLFSRKVSQLNMANVEDVTARQHGFMQSSFNFGTLTIETAGEQSNFTFDFCPNAGYYAKIILDSREKMLGQMHKDAPLGVEAIIEEKKNSNADPALEASDDGHLKDKAVKKSKKTGGQKPTDRKKSAVRGLGAEVVEHAMEDNYHS